MAGIFDYLGLSGGNTPGAAAAPQMPPDQASMNRALLAMALMGNGSPGGGGPAVNGSPMGSLASGFANGLGQGAKFGMMRNLMTPGHSPYPTLSTGSPTGFGPIGGMAGMVNRPY